MCLQERRCYADRQPKCPRCKRKSCDTLTRYECKSDSNGNGESFSLASGVKKKDECHLNTRLSFWLFVIIYSIRPFCAYAAGEAEGASAAGVSEVAGASVAASGLVVVSSVTAGDVAGSSVFFVPHPAKAVIIIIAASTTAKVFFMVMPPKQKFSFLAINGLTKHLTILAPQGV